MRWGLAALSLMALTACDNTPAQRLATPIVIEADAINSPLLDLTGNLTRGKNVFVDRDQGHCVLCHSIDSLDVEFQGDVGPNLTSAGDQLTPGQIRLRISDAQKVWPDTIMPSYYRTEGLNQVAPEYKNQPALTGQQIEDLVTYLSSLKG